MDIENKIAKQMEDLGCSRLNAIASMDYLGERSVAAGRASKNRETRKELMEYGMDFKTACLVVNIENG